MKRSPIRRKTSLTAVNRIQSELSRTALLEPAVKVTQRSLLED